MKGLAFLSAAENRELFLKRISKLYPVLDARYKLIEKAYNDAKDAFRGIDRDTSERYFEHLRAVALILIDYLRVKNHILIIAALLHDIVEDIPAWTVSRVEKNYGKDVALLVDWVSKPSKEEFSDKDERNKVYHNKFKRAPRNVFIIKLADRWHNLITLWGCSDEKQKRKIKETRRYYLCYTEEQIILIQEIEEVIARLENKES